MICCQRAQQNKNLPLRCHATPLKSSDVPTLSPRVNLSCTGAFDAMTQVHLRARIQPKLLTGENPQH